MEKLQAALEKARSKRNGMSPPERAKAPKPTASKPGGTDALWADLKPFDVDEKQLQRNRIVTREASSKAAPFDILRTKVLLQMRQNGWKRLAITSPMPRSGKTTTACNLALGLGRQSDLRSILMDLDLRDPSIHKFFDKTPEKGIGDVLSSKVSFADQAMRFQENVAVSMAKTSDADPTRLLLAEETAEVISQVEAQYQPDLMIFDLPSVLVNDDTRAFLKNVDCALIVARANKTRYSQFDTCEREIAEHTNVLGVVLNAFMSSGTD
ncbi:CpsD/CapB family tyrosine-protein kinase [Algirhabdus cladophorae]|uniref:CpsD/CapB family tyrosine-protein kinase n=1 Tax=Algirhabdus cladophorae TaxID=3377108 RepID=UPI003B847A5C